jgi:hypothetical protein
MNNKQLRELDARVAEVVFKRTVKRLGNYATMNKPGFPLTDVMVPRYSTDFERTFHVRDEMKKHPEPAKQNLRLVSWAYDRAYAFFGAEDEGEWSEGNGEFSTQIAICKAALKAYGVEFDA